MPNTRLHLNLRNLSWLQLLHLRVSHWCVDLKAGNGKLFKRSLFSAFIAFNIRQAQHLSPDLQNYDSARATAAGLLSFVFGNPNLNKQFLNFAEGNKDERKR